MISFKPINETEPFEATVTGKASPSDAKKFAPHYKDYRLVLNIYRGWDGDLESAVAAFSKVPVLRLSVFGDDAVKIDSLDQLPSLIELQVAGIVTGRLELDWFNSLESFGFGAELRGKKKVSLSWGKCQMLRSLGTLGSKLPPLEILRSFPKLERLQVVKPKFTPQELSSLERLARVDISYWTQLRAIQEMAPLSKRLTSLLINKASKLVDYSGIEQFTKLKELMFESCPPVPSVEIFSALKSLEKLFLINTKVIDGDLSPLMQMKSLQRIALYDQKNFTPSRDAVQRYFSLKREKK